MKKILFVILLGFLLFSSIGLANKEQTYLLSPFLNTTNISGTFASGSITDLNVDDSSQINLTEADVDGNLYALEYEVSYNWTKSTKNISKIEIYGKGYFDSAGDQVSLYYMNYSGGSNWNDTNVNVPLTTSQYFSATLCSDNTTCGNLLNLSVSGDEMQSNTVIRFKDDTNDITQESLYLSWLQLNITYNSCFPYDSILYKINSTESVECRDEIITLTGDLSIEGNMTLQNTTLKMNGVIDGHYNITVENGGNLSVNYSNISSTGKTWEFLVNTTANLTINNSEISAMGTSAYDGLYLKNRYSVIYNNTFRENRYGIYIDGGNNTIIKANNFTYNGIYDIFLTFDEGRPYHTNISENNFSRGSKIGIADYFANIRDIGSRQTNIFNNSFDGRGISKHVAIYSSARNIVIRHNNITGYTGYLTSFGGVVWVESLYNNITNNNFTNNYYIPISVYSGSGYGNFTDNEFYNNSHQIDIDTSTNNIFSGNFINQSNTGAGIFICNGDNNNVSNNVFNFTGHGIALCPNSDNNIFENNTIDYSGNGIYSYDSTVNWNRNNIYKNITITNTVFGIHTRGDRNLTLSNISISNSTFLDLQFNNTEVTGYNVILDKTRVDFYGWNFTMKNQSESASFPDSSASKNVSVWVNVSNSSFISWLQLNLSWSDSALGGIDESKIRMSKYSTGWEGVSGYELNETGNYVSANITSYSILAPMEFTATIPPGGDGGDGDGPRGIVSGATPRLIMDCEDEQDHYQLIKCNMLIQNNIVSRNITLTYWINEDYDKRTEEFSMKSGEEIELKRFLKVPGVKDTTNGTAYMNINNITESDGFMINFVENGVSKEFRDVVLTPGLIFGLECELIKFGSVVVSTCTLIWIFIIIIIIIAIIVWLNGGGERISLLLKR